MPRGFQHLLATTTMFGAARPMWPPMKALQFNTWFPLLQDSSVLGRDMPAGLNLTNMIHGMIHIKISECIEETIKMILLVWNL